MGFSRFGCDHMVIACTYSYIEIQTSLCDLNQSFNLKEMKAFFKALVWKNPDVGYMVDFFQTERLHNQLLGTTH